MFYSSLFCWAIFAHALFLCISVVTGSPITIYVSENGLANSTCLHDQGECSNLTEVIEFARNKSYLNITLLPAPGGYMFESTRAAFYNSRNITIDGSGDVPVSVKCPVAGVGISFVSSINIRLNNIVMTGCGMEHASTTKNFSNNSTLTFLMFNATLYFQQCANVYIHSVTITNSTGIGLQFYATTGENEIFNSNFTFNPPADDQSLPQCGGVSIEYPYCLPGDVTCSDERSTVPVTNISNSKYHIYGCNFFNNNASVWESSSSSFVLPSRTIHHSFGRGAGLSLYMKYNATNNVVVIEQCNFHENEAVLGGALMIAVVDNSTSNNVSIINSAFTCNTATSGGGAIFMTIETVDHFSWVHKNNISIVGSHFQENTADWGGGVSFIGARDTHDAIQQNYLTFADSVWRENVARLGAAVDLTLFYPILLGGVINAHFIRCQFLSNFNQHQEVYGKVVGMGTVYLDSVHGTFFDSVVFMENYDGTALVVSEAHANFSSNTSATFVDNEGRDGGAISLYGSSYLIIGENTRFNFTHNIANNLGGAIHHRDVRNRQLVNSRNCFIQYSNFSQNPSDWRTEFHFTQNSPYNSVIYSTTIIPCLWNTQVGPNDNRMEAMRHIFCWNGKWVYNGSSDVEQCTSAIETDPSRLEPTDGIRYLPVTPGRNANMNFVAYDDQDEVVTPLLVFSARPVNPHNVRVDSNFHYISNNKITLYQPAENVTTGDVVLETATPRVLKAKLNVSFDECTVGYRLLNQTCSPRGDYGGRLFFHPEVFMTLLLRGYWIGTIEINDTTELVVVARCKYCVFNTTEGFIDISDTEENVQEKLCGPTREGQLCAKCKEGYAPDFNSEDFDCVECDENNYHINWFYFALLKFVVPSIMFFLLYVTNFSLTSGLLNGAIFFAQMLTTAVSIDGRNGVSYQSLLKNSSEIAEIVQDLYRVLYDIWNLEFCEPCLPGMCLFPNSTAVQVLASKYAVAFLPLFIVLIALLVYWLDFLCSVVSCFNFDCAREGTRLSRLWQAIRGSAPTALAALIILSYSKIAIITAYLLAEEHFYLENGLPLLDYKVMYFDGNVTYFHEGHLPYAIPAVVVGIPFLFIIPLLLICCRYDDPNRKGGFFNHILREFQQEFRDGQAETRMPVHERERDYRIPLYCCEIDDRVCYSCTRNTMGELCSCKLKCCHGNCRCYMFWSRYDCRWMSGFYFVLRLALLLCFCYDFPVMMMYELQIIICLVSAMFILIVWPYKKDIYNVLDAGWLLLLVMIISLSGFQYFQTAIDFEPNRQVFWFQYVFLLVPAVFITICLPAYETYRQKHI